MSVIPDPPLPFTGGRIPASEDERAFVARHVMQQFLIAPGVSLALLLIGFSLKWPRLAAIGVISLGISALWIGYIAIRERRLVFIRGGTTTPRRYRFFIYEGVAAIPYGLTYVLGGICLIVPSIFSLTGVNLEQLRDSVLERPSLGLIPVGLLLLSRGLAFLVGFVQRGGSLRQRIFGMALDAPGRLGGLILLALALGALTIGMVDWLNPELFKMWFESTFGNPWPFRIG